jgi:hypothetical protein
MTLSILNVIHSNLLTLNLSDAHLKKKSTFLYLYYRRYETNYVMKTSFQYIDAMKTAIAFINAASAYEHMR